MLANATLAQFQAANAALRTHAAKTSKENAALLPLVSAQIANVMTHASQVATAALRSNAVILLQSAAKRQKNHTPILILRRVTVKMHANVILVTSQVVNVAIRTNAAKRKRESVANQHLVFVPHANVDPHVNLVVHAALLINAAAHLKIAVSPLPSVVILTANAIPIVAQEVTAAPRNNVASEKISDLYMVARD